MRTIPVLLLMLALFFMTAVGKSKAPGKPVKHKSVTVHQEADRLEYDDRQKVLHLSGHVKLRQESSLLEADEATYYLETQEATADGSLRLSNPEGTLTGKRLRIYYQEKRALVEGEVLLSYVPRKKGENRKVLREGPITMSASQVEYRWGDKVAVAAGNVFFQQKGRKAYADRAVFEETPEQLTMDGHVRLLRPPKDELVCDHLVYHLNTNQALAEGHVSGTFLVRDKNPAKVERD